MIQSKKLLMNDNVTLTVVTTPAAATCTLTYNSVQYSTKTLTVPKGATVSYSVYYSTYGTTSGSITMDKDKTLTCTGTSSSSSTDVSWSRPNLTSDGTMGGSSCAASASTITSGSAYYAFDNRKNNYQDTGCQCAAGDSYWTFYTPTAVKPTSMSFMYASKHTTIKTITAYIQASTNGSSYSSLSSFSWSVRTQWNATQTASVSLSTSSYYKYFRLKVTTQEHTKILIDFDISGYYKSSSTSYYWNKSIT